MIVRDKKPPKHKAPPIPKKTIQQARERSLAGRKALTQYEVSLRKIAKQVGDIIREMSVDGVVPDVDRLTRALNLYSDVITPWAESVAARMVNDVSRRDAAAWERHGKLIGRALRREIESTPLGATMREAMAEQVQYITTIPRDAAIRVQKLSFEALTDSTRASEIAKEIMRSGEVSKSNAMRLARTGVSSTATALTEARAKQIGSDGYIWRTSKDGRVRKTHKAMEGKFVRWDDPPTIDGMTGHCGEFANCRCFPEVVLPDSEMRVQ